MRHATITLTPEALAAADVFSTRAALEAAARAEIVRVLVGTRPGASRRTMRDTVRTFHDRPAIRLGTLRAVRSFAAPRNEPASRKASSTASTLSPGRVP